LIRNNPDFSLNGIMLDSCPDIIETIKYIIDRYGFDQRECIYSELYWWGSKKRHHKTLGEDKETLIDQEILLLIFI